MRHARSFFVLDIVTDWGTGRLQKEAASATASTAHETVRHCVR